MFKSDLILFIFIFKGFVAVVSGQSLFENLLQRRAKPIRWKWQSDLENMSKPSEVQRRRRFLPDASMEKWWKTMTPRKNSNADIDITKENIEETFFRSPFRFTIPKVQRLSETSDKESQNADFANNTRNFMEDNDFRDKFPTFDGFGSLSLGPFENDDNRVVIASDYLSPTEKSVFDEQNFFNRIETQGIPSERETEDEDYDTNDQEEKNSFSIHHDIDSEFLREAIIHERHKPSKFEIQTASQRLNDSGRINDKLRDMKEQMMSSVDYVVPSVEHIVPQVEYADNITISEETFVPIVLPSVEYVTPAVEFVEPDIEYKYPEFNASREIEPLLEDEEWEDAPDNTNDELLPKDENTLERYQNENLKAESGGIRYKIIGLRRQQIRVRRNHKKIKDQGIPEKDYPTLEALPVVQFYCGDYSPGYYVDITTRCQVFHICHEDGQRSSFLCPVGTVFNQEYLVCDWWYNVDCESSMKYINYESLHAFGTVNEKQKIATPADTPHENLASARKENSIENQNVLKPSPSLTKNRRKIQHKSAKNSHSRLSNLSQKAINYPVGYAILLREYMKNSIANNNGNKDKHTNQNVKNSEDTVYTKLVPKNTPATLTSFENNQSYKQYQKNSIANNNGNKDKHTNQNVKNSEDTVYTKPVPKNTPATVTSFENNQSYKQYQKNENDPLIESYEKTPVVRKYEKNSNKPYERLPGILTYEKISGIRYVNHPYFDKYKKNTEDIPLPKARGQTETPITNSHYITNVKPYTIPSLNWNKNINRKRETVAERNFHQIIGKSETFYQNENQTKSKNLQDNYKRERTLSLGERTPTSDTEKEKTLVNGRNRVRNQDLRNAQEKIQPDIKHISKTPDFKNRYHFIIDPNEAVRPASGRQRSVLEQHIKSNVSAIKFRHAENIIKHIKPHSNKQSPIITGIDRKVPKRIEVVSHVEYSAPITLSRDQLASNSAPGVSKALNPILNTNIRYGDRLSARSTLIPLSDSTHQYITNINLSSAIPDDTQRTFYYNPNVAKHKLNKHSRNFSSELLQSESRYDFSDPTRTPEKLLNSEENRKNYKNKTHYFDINKKNDGIKNGLLDKQKITISVRIERKAESNNDNFLDKNTSLLMSESNINVFNHSQNNQSSNKHTIFHPSRHLSNFSTTHNSSNSDAFNKVKDNLSSQNGTKVSSTNGGFIVIRVSKESPTASLDIFYNHRNETEKLEAHKEQKRNRTIWNKQSNFPWILN